MIYKQGTRPFQQVIKGVSICSMTHGEHTLMVEFFLEKDAVLPVHQHPYEQTGYLVRGRMWLTIGAKVHDIGPGDSWCIPSDIPHGAEIVEDALAVEVFSPLREDYLPENIHSGS
jgi:quercetin dioxygenase-like cupin family protein